MSCVPVDPVAFAATIKVRKGKGLINKVCVGDTAEITAIDTNEQGEDGQIFYDETLGLFYIGMPDGSLEGLGGGAASSLCDSDSDTCFLVDVDGGDSDVAGIQAAGETLVRVSDPSLTTESRLLVGDTIPIVNGAQNNTGLGGYVDITPDGGNAIRNEWAMGDNTSTGSAGASMGTWMRDFSGFGYYRVIYTGATNDIQAVLESQDPDTGLYSGFSARGYEAVVSARGAFPVNNDILVTATETTLRFDDTLGAPQPFNWTWQRSDGQLNTGTALKAFADDTAAGVGGLVAGDMYQTDGTGAAPLNAPGIVMIKQ